MKSQPPACPKCHNQTREITYYPSLQAGDYECRQCGYLFGYKFEVVRLLQVIQQLQQRLKEFENAKTKNPD